MRLPPGPPFAALQTVRYALAPYDFYRGLARRYGDVFTVPTLLGPLVVAAHPDGVRAIFTAEASDVARWATDAASPLVGENALMVTHGEPHRRARKLLMPPFNGARMRAYGDIMLDAARREASRWPGGAFTLLDSTLAISLDVVMRAVFGVTDADRLPRLERAIFAARHALAPSIMLFKVLRRRFGGVGPWARFVGARDRLDALVYQEIAERRARGAGDDILSLMIDARYDDGGRMTDQEIRDQLVMLVFTAHETTGVALCWGLYWLARYPAARARLEAELASLGEAPSPDALAAAPYLDAVCQETLRLHPVIPEVIRLLLQPLTIQGFAIPAGTAVAACTTAVHERPEIYPDPHAFRPERFLERTFTPFEHLPFGGGSRRCIGAAFGLYQMKMVLGALVADHRVELARPGPVAPALRNLTMGPKDGVVVRASRRRAAG